MTLAEKAPENWDLIVQASGFVTDYLQTYPELARCERRLL